MMLHGLMCSTSPLFILTNDKALFIESLFFHLKITIIMGIIAFYEGNNGTQNIVQTVEDIPGQDWRPTQNDAIRSAKIYGVRPGCEIRVYDALNGDTNDDFCIVNVKREVPEYVIDTFEKTYEDEYVRVTFIRNNGLDGKISRIRVD
jgi:hypothetical protein